MATQPDHNLDIPIQHQPTYAKLLPNQIINTTTWPLHPDYRTTLP